MKIAESVLEDGPLEWLCGRAYEVLFGLVIAVGECADYSKVFVFDPLQIKLEYLNPIISKQHLDRALRDALLPKLFLRELRVPVTIGNLNDKLG